jgi:hypothetical protein
MTRITRISFYSGYAGAGMRAPALLPPVMNRRIPRSFNIFMFLRVFVVNQAVVDPSASRCD